MLRSVQIENFLSFAGEQSIPLSQRSNVLVGINGSGKTNLIRAFQLLNACAREDSLPVLLTEKWGADVFNFNASAKGNLTIIYEFEASKISTFGFIFPSNVFYKITIRKVGSTNYQIDERIYTARQAGHENDYLYLDTKGGRGVINTRESGGPNLIPYPPENGKSVIFKQDNPVLAQISEPDKYYSLFTLRKVIGEIIVYHQFDTSLRSPIRTPAAYATDNRLQEDGNNIVPLLKRIQNHYPLVYENTLKPLLAKINPHFREIGFEDLGAKSNLVLREHELAKRVSIEHISDGTLRFILLLGILYNPDRGSLICLDEPETGLHPDMIHTVAEGIQQAAREGTQMVVATHSPTLLNSFRLDDLIVFDKNERNETQTSTPSENDFETWAEGFLPGKMWLHGIRRAEMGLKPTLFVEGGAKPRQPANSLSFAGVADGTERLQEALYKLFGQKIPQLNIRFAIEASGGYRQVLRVLYNQHQAHPDTPMRALIDSDAPPSERASSIAIKLNEVSGDVQADTTHLTEWIYLMVQAIEAWFSAQPKAIERAYPVREKKLVGSRMNC